MELINLKKKKISGKGAVRAGRRFEWRCERY